VAVTGGNFAATVKAGWIPLASCSGPIGPVKTCTLPLGAGSLTLNQVDLPIQPGPAAISLTVSLAASLPAQLASTTTHATATSTSGQKMVCLDIFLKDALDAMATPWQVGADSAATRRRPSPAAGGCSAADQAKINARGGGDAEGHFPKDTEECSRKCLSFFYGIEVKCFDKCLVEKLQISSGCAHCYWEAAEYGFENCKFACMDSWCSSGCLKCTAPGGSKADACAGFHSTSQPVSCDEDNAVV